MEDRGGSCAFGGSHGIREEVDGERTLPDRFKRAFRPRRTCSSKLYETSLHASATSLSLPLFSAHVPFRTCACTWTCTYTRIYVYEWQMRRGYTFLSLSDRLNPRPVFLFKVRAFVRNGFRVVRRFDRCASTVSIAFNGFSIVGECVVTFSNLPRSRVSRYLLLRR